jgi:hypothetical protein
MGSYSRFPKSDPAAEANRRRDEEWRDEEFRKALRTLPKPQDRIDMSKFMLRPFDRADIAELLSGDSSPTLH